MHSILIPIDGSKSSLNAVRYAIASIKEGLQADIHLINIQPVMVTVEGYPLFDYADIEKAQQEQGKALLAEAGRLLDEAELGYTTHFKIGPISFTIVEYAKTLNCDNIIMGTRGMGAFANLLIGSVTNQVIHLAEIPVTLVK